MQRKLTPLFLLLALSGLVHAQDAKSDPTGTWKQTNPASQTRETTFTFKLQGQSLTGAVQKNRSQFAITNGVVKGDQVSFQTRHEASAPKGTIVTTTFSGTLSGDTVTGTMGVKTEAMDYGTSPWQIRREIAKPKDGGTK